MATMAPHLPQPVPSEKVMLKLIQQRFKDINKQHVVSRECSEVILFALKIYWCFGRDNL